LALFEPPSPAQGWFSHWNSLSKTRQQHSEVLSPPPAVTTARKDMTMAGQFEIFTDAEANVRFRLLAADGTVLAISKAFEDKRQAANGIMAVRECAGTGLIREVRSSPRAGHHGTKSSSPTPATHHHHRHLPAV
jgi:uncharacterized protein